MLMSSIAHGNASYTTCEYQQKAFNECLGTCTNNVAVSKGVRNFGLLVPETWMRHPKYPVNSAITSNHN